MPWEDIFLGSVPGDGTGEPARAGGNKINRQMQENEALQSRTANAGALAYNEPPATDEVRLQRAVDDAVLNGDNIVFIPADMLPLDITLVTLTAFNAVGGRLVREGGSFDVYDVQAYGAAPGSTSSFAAQQAAFTAIPANGGVVYYPAATGPYTTDQEIIVPGDRVVTVRGDGAFGTNQDGLASFGSIIKRHTSYTSGPLMSQLGGSGSQSKWGVQMFNVGFDGNNLAGDLLELTNCAQARLEEVLFFNGNGNGLLLDNFQNSLLNRCRFFELGNNTAFPNGKSSVAIVSSGTGGSNTIFITDCHWEGGRGSYLTSNDPSGTHPIDIVVIIGGKMEWTGNASTGFEPPAASALGMPFVIPNNGTRWVVRGLATIGGYHTSATHWKLQNVVYMHLDLLCSMVSGKADNQNPRYFVDVFSGSEVIVGGTFINGASTSAGTGAQVRVIESSVTRFSIAPDSQFVAPLSGFGITYTNPTTGKASRMPHSGAVQDKSFSLTGATSTAINAHDGNYVPITIGSNIAVVAAIPTNPPPTGQSQEITVEFFNNSGGALSTAPTFATGTNGFLVPGTIVNPSTGTSVLYTFRWSPIRAKWIPTSAPQSAGL